MDDALIPLTPMDLAGAPEVPDGDVLLWREEDGLVVLGAERDRRQVLAELGLASTAAGVVATVAATTSAGGDYFKLTSESARRLLEFGPQFDKNNSLHGFLKSGNKFAGDLRFDQVSFAPQQALALQTAAVSLALRCAIADVQAAVERVEDKIEDVQRHLRAQLNGDVLGTLRHLERVATSTQQRGFLLEADWATVAGVRADISRNLERLRHFVVHQASDIDARTRLPKREAKLDDFLEPGGGRDQLNLILISEHSLHLWEMLRVAQVRQREPAHVESAIADARRSLAEERRRNEEVVAAVMECVDELRQVRPLEFHRVFSAREMRQTAADIHEALQAFSRAARLPIPELGEVVLPTAKEARGEARARALETARGAKALGAAAAKSGSTAFGRSREAVRRRTQRNEPTNTEGD